VEGFNTPNSLVVVDVEGISGTRAAEVGTKGATMVVSRGGGMSKLRDRTICRKKRRSRISCKGDAETASPPEPP